MTRCTTNERWVIVGLLLLLAGVASCDLPRDPEETLRQAYGDTLVVGVVEAPPHLVRSGDGARGSEAELVRAFARSIGADIDWRWGSLDEHMRSLEEFDLHVLAAGLTRESPWASRVTFTRPWRRNADVEHVLAVPPGENELLVALERVIESHKDGIP